VSVSVLHKAHRTVGLAGLALILMALSLSMIQAPQGSERTDIAQVESVNVSEPLENPPLDDLQKLVNNWAEKLDAEASMVIIDQSGQTMATLNTDKSIVSASLYKLFVAYLTYQDMDQGLVSYQTTLTVTDELEGESEEPETTQQTIDHCLRVMIITSDNPCGVALAERVGWQAVDSRLNSAGFSDTKLNNAPSAGGEDTFQYTTANDVATLLKQLASDEILSEVSRDNFMALLSQQQINDRVPLDTGIEFAHKTANLNDVFHDAGFMRLSDGTQYTYVVMTEGWQGSFFETAQQSFRELFEMIIEWHQTNKS